MSIKIRRDPGGQDLIVWGTPTEVRRWLEQAHGVEWFTRPEPHAAGALVRVRMRQPANRYRRVAPPPWWRDRNKVAVAGVVAVLAVAGIGAVLWLLAQLVVAVVAWLAANWPLVVAFAAVAALALFALNKVGGGCAGTHCSGCRRH